MENLTFKVTKLDAAKRQLSTAIDLYFWGGDPVSIRALSEASLEVLCNLSNNIGIESSSLEKFINNAIPPEKKKEFREALNRTKNFLKHADKDPEGVLDFNPSGSSFLMHEAIEIYETLSSELPVRFAAFRVWFRMQHPEIYKGDPLEKKVEYLQKEFGTKSKQQFLQEFECMQNMAIAV